MPQFDRQSARLSQRDQLILEHVARYRITTNEVVHKLHFRRQRPNAVTKVTARLTRLDSLRRATLDHPRAYFTLGSAGTAMLGLPENRALPLGPQSLPTEFGVLAFAALGRSTRRRLTRQELQERFPDFEQGIIEQAYCLDAAGVLELVRVDLGGAPDHIARKCRADMQSRLAAASFAKLIAAGQFRLVVVSCTTEKAAAIGEALQRHLWPDGLLFHLAVVPELILLTASLNDAS